MLAYHTTSTQTDFHVDLHPVYIASSACQAMSLSRAFTVTVRGVRIGLACLPLGAQWCLHKQKDPPHHAGDIQAEGGLQTTQDIRLVEAWGTRG